MTDDPTLSAITPARCKEFGAPDDPPHGFVCRVGDGKKAASRYANPMTIECHQGLHAPDCAGGFCTCECHKRKTKEKP